MFVILVYDVSVKRVAKVLKTCRQYLYWVQNSVFEGEISEGSYLALMRSLSRLIDKDHDSVIVYRLDSRRYSSREILGLNKGGEDLFI